MPGPPRVGVSGACPVRVAGYRCDGAGASSRCGRSRAVRARAKHGWWLGSALSLVALWSVAACGSPSRTASETSSRTPSSLASVEPTAEVCFSNTEFHARVIPPASLDAEITKGRDALGVQRLPIPTPPDDVGTISTGLIPSNNGTGMGFNVQFNWYSEQAPVVGFLLTTSPRCSRSFPNGESRTVTHGGTPVTIFPVAPAPGGLTGLGAHFRTAEVYVEINVLWDPSLIPDQGDQEREMARWIDAVLQ